MKNINKIIILIGGILISNYLYAQPGHSPLNNIIKQQPRVNGILKATTNASAKAKIHANSNSVFGPGNTHTKYKKKEQPKKEEIKEKEGVKKVNKQKTKKTKKK